MSREELMGDVAAIGPFEISGLIGTGGTSAVFRGAHRTDGTASAVKVLTGKFARRDEFRRAVHREIRSTSKLNHPGIVDILDFGDISDETEERSEGRLEAGSPWYAMELVEGDSLSEATMAWNWWLFRDVLLDLLDALAHAHAADVVHRDLKPGNVLTAEGEYGDSRIKLIDFGIARSFDVREPESEIEVFADADIFGTPKYMAPEQILGHWRDQGPWTDLYSVGALAWSLACGHPPFDADETARVLRAHIHGHLPPFDSTIPVPDGFEEWVARLLAKDPRERFRRAADAAFALLTLGDPDEDGTSAERRAVAEESSTGTSRRTLGVLEDTTGSDFTESVDELPSVPGLGGSGRADADVFEGVTAVAGAPTAVPPFPEEWRRQSEYEDRSIEGAGLNLLGLRTVPIVDREPIREQLWSALEQVCRQGEARGVVLRAPSGFGKTRLATWLRRRAHEVGAAEALVASHSRVMGESDGLGPMLARHFRCATMVDDDAYERVRAIYENLGFPERTARYDALGLISMMKLESTDQFEPTGFRTPQERHLALARLLDRLGDTRPIVLILDDAQWGPQSIEFANFLLENSSELPVFVLATVSRESPGQPLEQGELLEEFATRAEVDAIRLGQLDQSSQRELFDVLLPFHPGLAREAARRTRGDPLFAVQLVDDWAEEELLEPSPRGYSLRAGVEEPFPDDIHRLWERRVDRLADALDGADADTVSAALELAAALGRILTRREWTLACERADIPIESQWIGELLRRGLASERGEHFVLGHETLRQALADRAHRRDRWQSFQATCAEVVAELYGATDSDEAVRRAHHLLEAGRRRESIEALLDAGRRAAQKSETGPLRRLIQRAERILGDLQTDPSDPLRVRATWMRGWLHRGEGRPARARECADRALERARRADQATNAAWSLVLRGSIERDAGRFEAAFPFYERANEQFDDADDELGVAVATFFTGLTHARRCEWESGARLQERAQRTFDRLDDRVWRARVRTSRSQILIALGRYDEAEELSREAMRLARRSGNRSAEASAWNDLGEIARFQSNWERARECYRRGEQLYESAGSRARYTVRLNRALVDLETGEYSRAAQVIDDLAEVYPEIGYGKHVPMVYLAKMWCAAGREDWEAWSEARDAYRAFVRDREFEASEGGYLLEQMARTAVEVGRPDCAEEAMALARDLYEELGEDENRREAEARRRELAEASQPSRN